MGQARLQVLIVCVPVCVCVVSLCVWLFVCLRTAVRWHPGMWGVGVSGLFAETGRVGRGEGGSVRLSKVCEAIPSHFWVCILLFFPRSRHFC